MDKKRILVVEDEEDIQALIIYNLEKAGFETLGSDTGEEAIARVREFKPDLVVLDLMLPGIDGLEVCSIVKNEPEFNHIPIVMLTAKSEDSDVIAGLERGAEDYITKPFSPSVFLARIKTVLRRRESIKEISKSLRQSSELFQGSINAMNAGHGDIYRIGRESDIRPKSSESFFLSAQLVSEESTDGEMSETEIKQKDRLIERFLTGAGDNAAFRNINNSQALLHFRKYFEQNVRSLLNAIEARDTYTKVHTERVTTISMAMAVEMGLEQSMVENIYIGCHLHDIGKIGIPDAILRKPSILTSEEYEVMKSHVMVGMNIVKDIPELGAAMNSILYHHERFDGRGYPNMLNRYNIPIEGRVTAVADSFDAMTSDRPYRKAMMLDNAVNELRRCSGSQFDPEIVEVAVNLIKNGTLDDILDTVSCR